MGNVVDESLELIWSTLTTFFNKIGKVLCQCFHCLAAVGEFGSSPSGKVSVERPWQVQSQRLLYVSFVNCSDQELFGFTKLTTDTRTKTSYNTTASI